MPRFLAPIIAEEEIVTGNETISGSETILGATSGRDSYWDSTSIVNGLSADYATFVHNVSASAFYGDGSHLTGIVSQGNYLPLSGGSLTGGITGTNAVFSNDVYGSTATLGASSTQLANTAYVYDSINTGLASGSAIASTVVALVTNADTVPLTRGTVVYSYGSQGDRVSVRMASASSEATSSKTLGFVNETIAVGSTGYVTLYGAMDKLDLGAPFVAGDPLWLGTIPGTYTRVKPSAPTHLVYLGVVQRANAGNGTAYIKVQNGYELDELHDVLITSPLSSQILQRNSDNTLWINQTPTFAQASDLLNYLPLSGGALSDGLTASSFSGNGSNLTNLNASHISSGTLSSERLPAFTGDVTTTAGTSNATVVKMQGYNISTATPSTGQMLQWSGTAWVPGNIPNGGSGGGGINYYLNHGLSADNPIAGLPGTHYQLGRFTTLSPASATVTNVTQTGWDTIDTFISDHLDPSITTIPAGLWDLNFWASSTSSFQSQMRFRYQIYTYSETLSTTTLIGTSDIYNIYDPSVIAQYVLSMVIPQTTIDINARIFIVLEAQSVSPNKDITIYYNDDRPTHLHTTIPSVGGSGLVKVINGVYQSPASLLVDVDVADNAQINQTKVSGLTAALDSKLDKSGGTINGNLTITGTFSTVDTDKWISNYTTTNGNSGYWSTAYSAATGLPTTYLALSGGSLSDGLTAVSATFTASVSSPTLSGTHYGSGNNLTNLNASNISSGVLTISNGGTNASTIGDARTTLGGVQPVLIRHNSLVSLAVAGTITNAVWTTGSPTLTFTSSSTTLSTGMSIQATGLTTAVIKSVDSPTQVTMSSNATAGGSGNVSVYSTTTTGLTAATGSLTMDGKTLSVGDVVLLTAQTASAQNGPWVVQTVGATGVSMVLTRPSWFTGTLNGPMLFGTQQGLSNSGYVICVTGTLTGTNTSIGIDSLASNTVSQRATIAVLSNAQTFTQRQTFAAGTTTVNPISFQTGVVMTTPVANAVEWDGNILYTTTSAPLRTAQAAFVAGPANTGGAVPASSGSGGINGMMAYDANFLYICVGSNTWRRVPLNTF